jgi:LytS/YehU family sensor histidine kinase
VHFANNFGSCFFALITGALFKSFTESLSLREKQAEIQKKHLETELNILKAQVQPHFLFNTFNNLYYDTYKTLPSVAERMVMLSDIMRYFMEESPKERVPLSTEIEFVKDIVRLEQIRVSCPVNIMIDENIDTKLLVPPMLLIPLVENVFKHGVKSNGKDNTIDIKIMYEKNKLNFYTKNKSNTTNSIREGIGLQNLRERLALLFKDEFTLKAFQQDAYFIVMLTIPVYEN